MGKNAKNKLCRKIERQLQAYYDGQLPPPGSARVKEHVEQCESCFRKLEIYSRLSRVLHELARDELKNQESVSFWPAIRSRLVAQPAPGRFKQRWEKAWLWPRPVWLGLAISAVVLMIVFFSALIIPAKLPRNYCRIESISAPQHNLMIYQEKADGFTIIWLME